MSQMLEQAERYGEHIGVKRYLPDNKILGTSGMMSHIYFCVYDSSYHVVTSKSVFWNEGEKRCDKLEG